MITEHLADAYEHAVAAGQYRVVGLVWNQRITPSDFDGTRDVLARRQDRHQVCTPAWRRLEMAIDLLDLDQHERMST